MDVPGEPIELCELVKWAYQFDRVGQVKCLGQFVWAKQADQISGSSGLGKPVSLDESGGSAGLGKLDKLGGLGGLSKQEKQNKLENPSEPLDPSGLGGSND